MSKIPGSNKGRNRNRNNGGKRPQGRSGNFDSNGGRNRGNAQQLMDKFLSLARDANSQGDRIAAENYFQHADHYYRVVHARNEQQEARRRTSNNNDGQQQQGGGDPIPVQPSGGDSGPVGPVGLVAPKEPVVAPKEPEVQKKEVAPESKSESQPTEVVVSNDQPDAEPVAPKKPRRGRPPKKAAVAVEKEPAPTEAAE